jgi:heme O synthase-like polyprenyltransferase
VAAVVLGVGMIWMSLKLIRIADKATAKRTYKYSTAYLAFLFLAMMLDRVININVF